MTERKTAGEKRALYMGFCVINHEPSRGEQPLDDFRLAFKIEKDFLFVYLILGSGTLAVLRV